MKKYYRKSGFMAPSALSYEGIVLQSRRTGQQHVLTVFTKQAGIMRVFIRHSRKGKQGYGVPMVLSIMTFDAMRQGDGYVLHEYDSRSNEAVRRLTLDGYVYVQMFLEMILALIPAGQADTAVYMLLEQYARAAEKKDIRMATIVAGWQLAALAGFAPDRERMRLFVHITEQRTVYCLADEEVPNMEEVALTTSFRQDWQTIFQYQWGQTETVCFREKNMTLLEQILYDYVEQCSEKPLRSRALWENVKHI